jgi:hypothetical protein
MTASMGTIYIGIGEYVNETVDELQRSTTLPAMPCCSSIGGQIRPIAKSHEHDIAILVDHPMSDRHEIVGFLPTWPPCPNFSPAY